MSRNCTSVQLLQAILAASLHPTLPDPDWRNRGHGARTRSKTSTGRGLFTHAPVLRPGAASSCAKTGYTQSAWRSQHSLRELPHVLELEAHPQHS
jgi:hypothetical protein